MIRSMTLFTLVLSSLVFASSKQLTGKQAASNIMQFDSVIPGDQNCVMHFVRKDNGLLVFINSTEATETLASTFLSYNADVTVTTTGNGGFTKSTYSYTTKGLEQRITLVGYEDISNFDLTIKTEGKKAVTCSFQE